MPTSIHRDQIGDFLRRGAQLVEVLPAPEYEQEHLVGARSIPIKRLTAETTADLDRFRPVIVYCWDSL